MKWRFNHFIHRVGDRQTDNAERRKTIAEADHHHPHEYSAGMVVVTVAVDPLRSFVLSCRSFSELVGGLLVSGIRWVDHLVTFDDFIFLRPLYFLLLSLVQRPLSSVADSSRPAAERH